MRKYYILRPLFIILFGVFMTYVSLQVFAVDHTPAKFLPVIIGVDGKGKWSYIAADGTRFTNGYEDIKVFNGPIGNTSNGGCYPAKLLGKFGFLDDDENWAIEPIYESVENFRCDRALVKTFDGNREYIDPNGKVVFQLTNNEFFGEFSENMAFKTNLNREPSYFFVDINGQELFSLDLHNKNLTSDSYPTPTYCSEGKIAIKNNNLWGFINNNGVWTIPTKFEHVRPFTEGLAAAQFAGKWGYINETGGWVIYPQFDEANQFSEGLASVKRGKYWVFIDQKGKSPFLNSFYENLREDSYFEGLDENAYIFKEGLACVYLDYQSSDMNNGYNQVVGYIDKHGQLIIYMNNTGYINGRSFQSGLAKVYSGPDIGAYIDHQGNYVAQWHIYFHDQFM